MQLEDRLNKPYYFKDKSYFISVLRKSNESNESLVTKIKTEGEPCAKCKSTNTISSGTLQLRSADEGGEIMNNCLNCGARFQTVH